MFFAALILSMVIGRVLRGCLKWLLLAALLAWIAKTDPVLSDRIWVLLSEAWRSAREFILSL